MVYGTLNSSCHRRRRRHRHRTLQVYLDIYSLRIDYASPICSLMGAGMGKRTVPQY